MAGYLTVAGYPTVNKAKYHLDSRFDLRRIHPACFDLLLSHFAIVRYFRSSTGKPISLSPVAIAIAATRTALAIAMGVATRRALKQSGALYLYY